MTDTPASDATVAVPHTVVDDFAVERNVDVAEDHSVSVVAGYAERGGDSDSGELYNAAVYVPARRGSGASPDERETLDTQRELVGAVDCV